MVRGTPWKKGMSKESCPFHGCQEAVRTSKGPGQDIPFRAHPQ
jgi:hypothetical protein